MSLSLFETAAEEESETDSIDVVNETMDGVDVVVAVVLLLLLLLLLLLASTFPCNSSMSFSFFFTLRINLLTPFIVESVKKEKVRRKS